MVLNIGDIVEKHIWMGKYHILNITETEIITMRYNKDDKPYIFAYDKEDFKLNRWKPAQVKWY